MVQRAVRGRRHPPPLYFAVHSEYADKWVWQHFWDTLDYFLEVSDAIDFEGWLHKYHHSPLYPHPYPSPYPYSPLYPYLVTLIGEGGMLKYVKWGLSPSRAVRGGVLHVEQSGETRKEWPSPLPGTADRLPL